MATRVSKASLNTLVFERGVSCVRVVVGRVGLETIIALENAHPKAILLVFLLSSFRLQNRSSSRRSRSCRSRADAHGDRGTWRRDQLGRILCIVEVVPHCGCFRNRFSACLIAHSHRLAGFVYERKRDGGVGFDDEQAICDGSIRSTGDSNGAVSIDVPAC